MFIIFGWGRKSRSWVIRGGKTVLATWPYVSLFFCPLALDITWTVYGDPRSFERVVSYEEIKELAPANTPQLGVWERFGLLFLVVTFSLFIIFTN